MDTKWFLFKLQLTLARPLSPKPLRKLHIYYHFDFGDLCAEKVVFQTKKQKFVVALYANEFMFCFCPE